MPDQEINKLLGEYARKKVDEEADRQGVPVELARRLAGQESSFDPDVITGRRRSSAGAIGTMQLMPGTARDLGVDPNDIDQNISGGVRYLKQQLQTFGGDQTKAAAAYNAGPGVVRKYGGVPPYRETQDYVRKVAGGQGDEIDDLYQEFQQLGEQPGASAAQPSPVIASSPRQSRPLTNQQRQNIPILQPVEQPLLRPIGAEDVIGQAQATAQRYPTSPEGQRRIRQAEEVRRAYEARSTLGRRTEDITRGVIGGTEGLIKAGRIAGAVLSPPGQNVASLVQALAPGGQREGLLTPAAREDLERRSAVAAQVNPFAGPVTEGLGAAAVQAPAYALAGGAGGIGGLAVLTAAQEELLNDPKRAAVRTAINSVLPVAAGRGLTRVIRPETFGGRIGTEAIGGAVGNVIPSAIEQQVFEGRINPAELARQAVIGGVASSATALPAARVMQGRAEPVPGAAEMAMRPRPERRGVDNLQDVEIRRVIDRYVQRVEEINRTIADPAERQAALDQARTIYTAERQAAQQPRTRQEPTTEALPQPVAEAAPVQRQAAPSLPPGVRIIRQGEPIPPPERGMRRVSLDVPRDDGTTETVMVVAPEKIGGQRTTEVILRPFVERALSPQPAILQAAETPMPLPDQTAPAQRVQAGADVEVFPVDQQPEFDPTTQKAVTFKGSDQKDYVAVVPKSMSRTDAAVFGRSRIPSRTPMPMPQTQAKAQPEAPPLFRPETQPTVEGGIPKTSERSELGAEDASALQKMMGEPSIARAFDDFTSGRSGVDALEQFIKGAQENKLSAMGIVKALKLGEPPAEALARLPKTRPGAPERMQEIGPAVQPRTSEARPSAEIEPTLMSAYRKLGTDDPEIISQMIRDSDKRFKKSATVEEADASAKAFAKISQLTQDEQAALSRVIPERTFAPVRSEYEGEGRYSRAVSDIPLSEKNPQLDKNLAEVMDFFDTMAKEEKAASKPKFVADAENRLRQYASGERAGFGTGQIGDLAVTMGYKVFQTVKDFSRWSQEMVRRLGEEIRPLLRPLWKQLREGVRTFVRDEEGSAIASPGPSKRAGQTAPAAPQGKPAKTAEVESASLGKAVGNVLRTSSQAMRTLWTSMDFSAPLSQGAILSIAHPVKAASSFGKMFRSLSQAQADAIDAEIAFSPYRKLGEDFGLFLATSGRLKGDTSATEEMFALQRLNELPGIRHSERAYRTYLDTLRLSTWESYVKTLKASGQTPETDPKAYRQMAEFINIASGRGSLKKGGKLEKASDLMGDVLFAPRNLIANFQVLDPVRYATLAPGARKVVLRDAVTVLGAMIGTAAILKAAGVNVGFDPEADDFMTARAGNTRYDLTGGKKTQVQFLAKMTMGIYRQIRGEGNLPGRDPLTVASRFGQGKLAPLYSTGLTFLKGRDYTGKKIADKSAAKIAWETAAPMLWRDLVESYQEEGLKGVAKASPIVFGARVNTYPDRARAKWLDTPAEVRAEQKKFGQPRTFLSPKKDEKPGEFSARRARAQQWMGDYGLKLVTSQSYKALSRDEQQEVLSLLKRRISELSDEKRPATWSMRAGELIQSAKNTIRERKAKQRAAVE